jgi:hypothetical protein
MTSTIRADHRLALAAIAATLVLAGCGGGGSDAASPPPGGGTSAAAAAATATSSSNACAPVRPFYWEIGDGTGPLASGTVNSAADPTVYIASTKMSMASASKWFYSTYFVQRTGGVLSASDIKFFNFQSGYSAPGFSCTQLDSTQTVQQCVDLGNNGDYNAANDGEFAYSGAHMEKHASLNGLGSLNSTALETEIRSQVGSDINFTYFEPQLAGGMAMAANDYAALLRKIVRGDLRMHDALGTHAVCTSANPAICPNAVFTPSPPGESWHYSVGHWVEDDPGVGDGAFSSPGAFGFYPWIDRTKTLYGVLARNASGGALASVYCGRLIRKAYVTATPQ